MADDNIQHGIDDNPNNDAAKGATLGGIGGALVGAAAGSMVGPVGTVVGAVVGGLSGAGASGLAVGAVDAVDNDNTVSGIGDGATTKDELHAGTTGATGAGSPGTTGTGAMGSGTVASAMHAVGTPTGETMANQNVGNQNLSGGELPRVSRNEYDRLSDDDKLRVQLIEEELHVDKQTRQSGEVEISTRVVEEQVNVPVTLQHEEVTITRHAVDKPLEGAVAGEVFQDQTIRVPIHEEVAHVTKTAHVAEEIEIEKRAVSEQRTVSDSVRREELEVHNPQTHNTNTDVDPRSTL